VKRGPLPVGVVGVGSLGRHHARLYATVPGARLVGVFDPRVRRAAEIAARAGATAYGSLDRLLDDVEAVSVVVPASAHREVGLAAITRGRHVLIEKPLAADLAEAEELVAAAERAGVVLQAGHVERFNGAVRGALRFLASPRHLDFHRAAPHRGRGGDVCVVRDLMIHDLDLALWLAGGPVDAVEASIDGPEAPLPDAVRARVVFESGAVAHFRASRCGHSRERRVRILQESGGLSLDLASGTGEFLRVRPRSGVAPGEGAFHPSDSADRIRIESSAAEPLALELESFVRSVRTGQPPAVSGRDGLSALSLAFSVLEAAGASAVQPV